MTAATGEYHNPQVLSYPHLLMLTTTSKAALARPFSWGRKLRLPRSRSAVLLKRHNWISKPLSQGHLPGSSWKLPLPGIGHPGGRRLPEDLGASSPPTPCPLPAFLKQKVVPCAHRHMALRNRQRPDPGTKQGLFRRKWIFQIHPQGGLSGPPPDPAPRALPQTDRGCIPRSQGVPGRHPPPPPPRVTEGN